jgi:cell wall-associated NlpC family hydrolase
MLVLRLAQFSLVLIFLVSLGLSGCASKPTVSKAAHKPVASKFIGKGNTRTRLQKYFNAWKGTPYKYGGLSKRGIDCSGFIYLTYRDVFGRKIPRSTELQAGIGQKISRKNLRVGDLVFFKTGFRQRHTGIYIGKGKFIHASSSRGVTTSRLDSPYWSGNYWKSIRVK